MSNNNSNNDNNNNNKNNNNNNSNNNNNNNNNNNVFILHVFQIEVHLLIYLNSHKNASICTRAYTL